MRKDAHNLRRKFIESERSLKAGDREAIRMPITWLFPKISPLHSHYSSKNFFHSSPLPRDIYFSQRMFWGWLRNHPTTPATSQLPPQPLKTCGQFKNVWVPNSASSFAQNVPLRRQTAFDLLLCTKLPVFDLPWAMIHAKNER